MALTVHAGTVHLSFEQHSQPGHLLPLQLIQASPHVVANQVQLLAEMAILTVRERGRQGKSELQHWRGERRSRSTYTGRQHQPVPLKDRESPWCLLCWQSAASLWSEDQSPGPRSLLEGTCHSTGQCPEEEMHHALWNESWTSVTTFTAVMGRETLRIDETRQPEAKHWLVFSQHWEHKTQVTPRTDSQVRVQRGAPRTDS